MARTTPIDTAGRAKTRNPGGTQQVVTILIGPSDPAIGSLSECPGKKSRGSMGFAIRRADSTSGWIARDTRGPRIRNLNILRLRWCKLVVGAGDNPFNLRMIFIKDISRILSEYEMND